MILRDNLILNEIIVYTSIVDVCINNYRSAKRLWAPFLFSLLVARMRAIADRFAIVGTKKEKALRLPFFIIQTEKKMPNSYHYRRRHLLQKFHELNTHLHQLQFH